MRRTVGDRLGDEAVVVGRAGKAAHHNLRRAFQPAGELVDGQDRHDEAVLAEMPAVADDDLSDDVGIGAGVDQDAADRGLAHAPRAQFVELQNVAALDHDDLSDRALHAAGQFGVALELAVFAVNGDEVSWPHQVDDQLQLLLAGVAADVHRRLGAILVDDLGVAAEEVVDDAEDAAFRCRESSAS